MTASARDAAQDPRVRHSGLFWSLLLAAASALAFGGLTAVLVLTPDGPIHEYDAHIDFAMRSFLDGETKTPHFLYQWLTVAHHVLLTPLDLSQAVIAGRNEPIRTDWAIAGLVAITEVYVALSLSLAWWLAAGFRRRSGYDGPAGYILAFCLGIAAPVFVLAPFDDRYYLGYIPPSTIYIIPTQVLLKLTTFWMFALAVYAFRDRVGLARAGLICVAAVLSALSKPNGVMVLLPALWILAIWRWRDGERVNPAVLAAVTATCAAVLLWQYHFKFVDPTTPIYRSSIILTRPFDFYRHYSDYVPIKLLVSLLFPLYVLLAYRQDACRDFHVRLAAVAFLAGLLMAAFLAESGGARYSGNFTWSAQIGCFLLFVATTAFFFGTAVLGQKRWTPAARLGIAIFGLHVGAGLVFYVRSFTHPFT